MAKKRQHLDSYVVGEDGSYEYQGTVWRWLGEQERRDFLRRAWLMLGAAVAGLIVAGFLPAPGGYAFYALIPYAAGVAATAFTGASLVKLGAAREGMAHELDVPEHVHAKSAAVLAMRSGAAGVACAVSALGEVVHAFVSGGAGLAFKLAFIAAMGVAAAALWLLSRHAGELPLEKLE